MNATIGISSPLLSNLRPHSSRLASPSPRCCPRWTPSRPSTHTSRLASTPPKKVGSFDPGLLLCDVVGIWATSFASERVPISTGLPLLVIQIGTWVLVSLLRGDYIRTGLTVDNPSSQLDFALGFPFSQVTQELLVTWLIFAPVSSLAWAYSPWVGDFTLDLDAAAGQKPPETEVVVAVLATLFCLRVLYYWWGPRPST